MNLSTEPINVHRELANAPVSRFHWRLSTILGALTLFDGYDTFNPAYVIHYVTQPWSLRAGQAASSCRAVSLDS